MSGDGQFAVRTITHRGWLDVACDEDQRTVARRQRGVRCSNDDDEKEVDDNGK